MHYASHELDQYRTRAMPWFQWLHCRLHLLHCTRCRARLTQLVRDDLLIHDLRNSEREMDVAGNSTELQRLHELLGAEIKRGSTV